MVLSSSVGKFRLGIQLADERGNEEIGETIYSNHLEERARWSEWAGDATLHNPDAVRVYLEPYIVKGEIWDEFEMVENFDFRLGIKLADKGNTGVEQEGDEIFTPWASEGGGWSEKATDANNLGPDVVSVCLQTRRWPKSVVVDDQKLLDIRIGIQLYHVSKEWTEGGNEQYTKWMSEGGGKSDWALDANKKDFDAARILLEVRTVDEYLPPIDSST